MPSFLTGFHNHNSCWKERQIFSLCSKYRDPQRTCTVEETIQSKLGNILSQGKNNQTKNSVNKSKQTTGLEVFTISKLILGFNYYSYCSGMFTTPPICLPEASFLRLAFPFPKSLQPLWRTKLHCWSSFTQERTSKDNFSSNRTSVTELSK